MVRREGNTDSGDGTDRSIEEYGTGIVTIADGVE